MDQGEDRVTKIVAGRPSDDGGVGHERVGQLFEEFLEAVARPPRSDSPDRDLTARLRDHLGIEPGDAPVVKATYAPYDHPNVHLALERWFTADSRSYELLGMTGSDHRNHYSLSEIIESADRFDKFVIGAVDYTHLPISPDDELACVSFGIYLGTERTPDGGEERCVALLRGPNEDYGREKVQLEVLAASRDTARRLLARVDAYLSEHNIFRGQVLSFQGDAFGEGLGPFRFHRRPGLTRDHIVLPDGLLDRVERQVVGVARQRERLRAAGQHLRRGLLLYGPPGTGKTHTIRYLLSGLPDFTVVLLSGTTIGAIGPACALARMLQPALVVLEDCDLIAESRDFGGGEQPLLFQVLNEMDGLGDDADVAFLLTTNRADLLEPALAQRPGRVDLAVEIPLPDATGRRRLLDLYGGGLGLDEEVLEETVERTDGTTASFAKELVRRAVLIAAERDADTEAQDVRAAVGELLSDQDQLTRRLLGVPVDEDPDDPEDDVAFDDDGDDGDDGDDDDGGGGGSGGRPRPRRPGPGRLGENGGGFFTAASYRPLPRRLP
ncbi:AAA family ATPase [Streptomyces flavofungini]|uniref:ATP-binding protein n=1 Tax=Streptomyces flavofungini TaxID=68200 RepID=A0ABS0WZI9_9ACTN|nr:ATP-binding protein [Streptomyces flavofungini]MBJ3806269.1 ATP-binding protein [Streptomyces flavofungini]GHC46247.1 ATPase [Streptomyces flavofungini]